MLTVPGSGRTQVCLVCLVMHFGVGKLIFPPGLLVTSDLPFKKVFSCNESPLCFILSVSDYFIRFT